MKKYVNKFNIVMFLLLLILVFLFFLTSLVKIKNPVKYTIDNNSISQLDRIKSNEIITIDFISHVDNLEAIEIPIVKIKNNNESLVSKNSKLVLEVYNQHNKKVLNNELNNTLIHNNEFIYLKFKPIKDSLNNNIKIIIKSNNISNDYNLQIKTLDIISEDIKTTYNNKTINSIPIAEYGYKNTPLYKNIIITFIFIILFILFSYNLNDKRRIKDYLIKNKKIFVLELIISILCFSSFLYYKYCSYIMSTTNYTAYILFIISATFLILIISMYIFDKNLKKEDLFLLIGIPISTMYLIFMLPTSIPDAYFHYTVAERMSLFRVFKTNININSNLLVFPQNYSELINNYLKLDYNHITKVLSGNYHPLLYLMSGLGILLSKALNFGPMISIYFGALFNQLTFLIIGYLTIKKIPFGKLVMIIYMLMPMFMQQTISISADSMLNIFSMLFIAIILYIKYDKKRIDNKDFILLMISILFILIGKYAYIFMLLLLLLIKKELKDYYFKNRKETIIMISTLFILIVGWMIYTKVNSTNTIINMFQNQRINPKEKLLHILNNPLNIITIISNTFTHEMLNHYLITTLGGKLGAVEIEISSIFVYTNLILLIIALLLDNKKESIKDFRKISIIVVLLTFCCIFGGLYLTWGVPTEIFISGVQGRYFLPFIILIPLLLINKNKILNIKHIEPTIIIIFIINNMYIISEVITYFLK